MANCGKTEVRIDMDSVTRELQNVVSSCDDNNCIITSSSSIFRVPNILYRHNPKAYEPNSFSIGPFHHNKPHLQDSQQIKVNYLKALLRRTSPDRTVVLPNLIGAVSQMQEAARSCYVGPMGMSTDDFVKTLVLDSCFLIELFLRHAYSDLREQLDPIFSMPIQLQYLNHDLILLENQIPWIVLNRLYEMTNRSRQDTKSLVQLAIDFFQYQSGFSTDVTPYLPPKAEHILDLLRSSMVMSSSGSSKTGDNYWEKSMPSVSTLKEAGIKVKVREKRDSISILDLAFDKCKGVLKIPRIKIDEITEPLFRNLISYEQCRPNCKGIVTSYAILMDNLINTKEDMEILEKSGVVSNWLNTEDSTKLFNQLYDDTCVKDFYYPVLIEGVNEYCRRRWPKYRRILVRDYFKHPWSLVSMIAAATLLTLAFLQTVFTIIN